MPSDEADVRKYHRKKQRMTAIVALLNVLLICCVILSVVVSLNSARKVSFSQNIENVRTLTDASASKVELELVHHVNEVRNVAKYMNDYGQKGMTLEEMQTFLKEYFTDSENESILWNLADSEPNEERGAKQGFDTLSLNQDVTEQISYKAQEYPELARIFRKAGADTLGEVWHASEFTDPSMHAAKYYAVTTPVRITMGDGTYEYKTLMRLINSDHMNQLIANNNDIDTFHFFDYSNIIIDNKGDYVISNGSFQGTNFMDYMKLYNEDFTQKREADLQEQLKEEDFSDVLFYKNNRGQDCVYTIVPVQNSDWHILSIVPLKSFHNAYSYGWNFTMFAVLFSLLFVVDMAYILLINHQLRKSTEEAREASYAKSQFLSSMSHDIRTPMNAIIGMTLIAEKDLKKENLDKGESNIEELRDCVNTIKMSGNHLLTLVNDILDISKIEHGKVVITPGEFSLKEDLNHMLEMIQPEILKKELTLEVHMEKMVHEFVFADALRINQIYLNIISNAIKYTNPGGTIQVTLQEQKGAEGYASFQFEVQDNGIGMDEAFLHSIFDRFSRAVDTRVNTAQGTGLGMAISKQLVDLMGGTIEVQSKLNEGSTFTVTLTLPLLSEDSEFVKKKTMEREEQESAEPGVQQRKYDLRVLVVEDNDVNWKILGKLLEMYGIFAERVTNGQEGLETVTQSSTLYDLIFMDIQMPVMNGYDATEAIRGLADSRKASVPIYAMTADTFAEDVMKCREKGMNGHLAKPVELDKLEKILIQIQDGKGTEHV